MKKKNWPYKNYGRAEKPRKIAWCNKALNYVNRAPLPDLRIKNKETHKKMWPGNKATNQTAR